MESLVDYRLPIINLASSSVAKDKQKEIDYHNLLLLRKLDRINRRTSAFQPLTKQETTDREMQRKNKKALTRWEKLPTIDTGNHLVESDPVIIKHVTPPSHHSSLDSGISCPELRNIEVLHLPDISDNSGREIVTPRPSPNIVPKRKRPTKTATVEEAVSNSRMSQKLERSNSLPQLSTAAYLVAVEPENAGSAVVHITPDAKIDGSKTKKSKTIKIAKRKRQPVASRQRPPAKGAASKPPLLARNVQDAYKSNKLQPQGSKPRKSIYPADDEDDVGSACSTPSPRCSDCEEDDFEPEWSARILHRIGRYAECVDEALLQCLGLRSYRERMIIKGVYYDLFGEELEYVLLRHLKPAYHVLVKECLVPKDMQYAERMYTYLQNVSKHIEEVVEILTVHNNIKVKDIKAAYFKRYATSLENDIHSHCAGQIKHFFVQLASDKQDNTASLAITKSLGLDQQQLFDEIRLGIWNGENKKFIALLGNSYDKLRHILSHFLVGADDDALVNLKQQDVSTQFIEATEAFLTCAWCPQVLYARRIHEHLRTDDLALLDTLLSRAQIDMSAICRSYGKRYEASLLEDLYNAYKNEAADVLLKMVQYYTDADFRTAYKNQFRAYKAQLALNDMPPQLTPEIRVTPQISPTPPGANRAETGIKVRKKSVWNTMPENEKRNWLQAVAKEGEIQRAKKVTQNNDRLKPKPGNRGSETQRSVLFSEQEITSPPLRTGEETLYQSTVSDNPNFDLDTWLKRLKGVLEDNYDSQWDSVARLLCSCSANQRHQIKVGYKEAYNADIGERLRVRLSHAAADAALLLMLKPATLAAYVCHNAIQNLGAVLERTLLLVLCQQEGDGLEEVRDSYRRQYGKELSRDIQKTVSGPVRSVLLALANHKRDTSIEVDKARAWSEGARLFKDSGNPYTLQESLLIRMLAKENRYQVVAVAQHYTKISGHTLFDAIKQSTTGMFRSCALSLLRFIKDPIDFFARTLHSLIHDKTQLDEMAICYLVIARSEFDLLTIKKYYLSQYKTSLDEDLDARMSQENKVFLRYLLDKELLA